MTAQDDAKDEIWKTIDGYPSYKVSSYGRVWSDKTKRFLKPHVNNHGYSQIFLSGTEKKKNWTVHRLMTTAFIGPSTLEVNHKDGDKLNNIISNLEYVTTRENVSHYYSKNGNRLVGFESRYGKHRAMIYFNKRLTSLGAFKTPEEAHAQYKKAANLIKHDLLNAEVLRDLRRMARVMTELKEVPHAR